MHIYCLSKTEANTPLVSFDNVSHVGSFDFMKCLWYYMAENMQYMALYRFMKGREKD